jgi:hypothetical protein
MLLAGSVLAVVKLRPGGGVDAASQNRAVALESAGSGFEWRIIGHHRVVDDEGVNAQPGSAQYYPQVAFTLGPKGCQIACDHSPECASFTKCGKMCHLKTAKLTGHESTHHDYGGCVSWYRFYENAEDLHVARAAFTENMAQADKLESRANKLGARVAEARANAAELSAAAGEAKAEADMKTKNAEEEKEAADRFWRTSAKDQQTAWMTADKAGDYRKQLQKLADVGSEGQQAKQRAEHTAELMSRQGESAATMVRTVAKVAAKQAATKAETLARVQKAQLEVEAATRQKQEAENGASSVIGNKDMAVQRLAQAESEADEAEVAKANAELEEAEASEALEAAAKARAHAEQKGNKRIGVGAAAKAQEDRLRAQIAAATAGAQRATAKMSEYNTRTKNGEERLERMKLDATRLAKQAASAAKHEAEAEAKLEEGKRHVEDAELSSNRAKTLKREYEREIRKEERKAAMQQKEALEKAEASKFEKTTLDQQQMVEEEREAAATKRQYRAALRLAKEKDATVQ